MESQLALKKPAERGQSAALFAVIIPVTVLFALGIIDYMVTNLRVMEALAAAELGAHAGAQVVRLLPDGEILPHNPYARQTAAAYFRRQAPPGAVQNSVACGLNEERPACWVSISVRSAGYLVPERWIRIRALGELAFGATRDGQ